MSAFWKFRTITVSECCLIKLLPHILLETCIYILDTEMASRGNQRCANSIGTLSFPVETRCRRQARRRFGGMPPPGTEYACTHTDAQTNGQPGNIMPSRNKTPMRIIAASSRAAVCIQGGPKNGTTDSSP